MAATNTKKHRFSVGISLPNFRRLSAFTERYSTGPTSFGSAVLEDVIEGRLIPNPENPPRVDVTPLQQKETA